MKRVANDAEESGAEGTDASAAVPADAPEVPDYVAAEAELVPAADGATSAGRCVDRGDATLCPYWAGMGECESNPEYMRAECAKSCRARAARPLPDRESSERSACTLTHLCGGVARHAGRRV